jgi:putative acetyltransferase
VAEAFEPGRLVVSAEDPRGPDAALLIARLSTELGERYGDDGAGAFAPEDVLVGGAAFVVARLEGRPVGCGALRPMADGAGEVKRLYVEPEARGRGVARQVLSALEALARGYGYRILRLETGLLQPESIRLYEAAGYTRIPCYGRYADNPLSVCFEKRLA